MEQHTTNPTKFQYFADETESLAGQLLEHIKQHRKVVRCVQCVNCRKAYAPAKMSSILVLCKVCFATSRQKERRERINFIDRAVNNFKIYLGGRI